MARRMMGIHHFETSITASWKRSFDRKRPLSCHSNSYSWKGKERTPPFGQTARVCTGKQTNLGFSEGIPPRQLEFIFFNGEVNVNFEWSTLCALGRRTMYLASHSVLCHCLVKQHSRNDKKKKKKKKKKIVRCQCTTKLTQMSSFSESHPSHGRARHQIRD